MVDPSAGYMLL